MKLGLVYRDDDAAPARPLSPYVFQICRPDFATIEVGSLEAVRSRVDQVQSLRLVANYVIPIGRLSVTSARGIARVLSDLAPASHLRRVTLGARPDEVSPALYLTKVCRLLGAVGLPRVTLGIGQPPPAWRAEFLDMLRRAENLHRSVSGVQVDHYPTGPTSWRAARRIVEGVVLALPGAAVHVETGWRSDVELANRDAWWTLARAWTTVGAPLPWAPLARPSVVTAAIRDFWTRDAWDAWTAAGAASLALFGHVENASASAGLWNVLTPALTASHGWSELRNLTTAVERARARPGLTSTHGARLEH